MSYLLFHFEFGFQMFLNGVSYSKMLRPKNVRATVKGLAGGRAYDVQLVAYPGYKSLKPRKSNILVGTKKNCMQFFPFLGNKCMMKFLLLHSEYVIQVYSHLRIL